MKTTSPELIEARKTAKAALQRLVESSGDGPATPEALAAALQAQGIKGIPKLGFACPVARYLKRALGSSCEWVSVGRKTVELCERFDSPESVRLRMPDVVADFVDRFDKEEYRELVG